MEGKFWQLSKLPAKIHVILYFFCNIVIPNNDKELATELELGTHIDTEGKLNRITASPYSTTRIIDQACHRSATEKITKPARVKCQSVTHTLAVRWQQICTNFRRQYCYFCIAKASIKGIQL